VRVCVCVCVRDTCDVSFSKTHLADSHACPWHQVMPATIDCSRLIYEQALEVVVNSL
jgi:hypothetical protein